MAAATGRAPSARNSQPWALETRGRDVLLVERVDGRPPAHDPTGRDRLISCGAALANLRVAVRRLGWAESWREYPLPDRRDVVALVRAGAWSEPTAAEMSRYAAIGARRSHRPPFASPPAEPARLVEESDVAGAAVVLLDGQARDEALARLLRHAVDLIGKDPACRAELSAWTEPRSWDGLDAGAAQDPVVQAARFSGEAHFVVTTTGDGPGDHLRAGVALEQTWLAATSMGLAASVITQPLHLPEVRAGLVEAAELPGFPQAVLRVGVPAVDIAPTPRRPVTAVLLDPAT
ncbi:nitroreductase family protein [Actinokineospora fastidiosa]|nr:nitroreductase family protein [Actinokineospora fastidiosa]